MEKGGWVYILTNRPNGTLYMGVTNDLARRIAEHRQGTADGFTRKHQLKHLVYAERHSDITEAIAREKRIKTWLRAWKIRLIVAGNPEWRDLFEAEFSQDSDK